MSSRTGGRQPGSKNKVTKTAKENVLAVFNRLGGTAAMAKWAQENQTDFYRLYAKLIPQQIDLDVNIKEKDLSVNPLPADDWDKTYGSSTQPN